MHVIELRGLRNLPFRCEYCGEVFTNKKALQDHLWMRHGKTSNHTCLGHFEIRFLKGLPYRCEYCGRTFNTESALQQHINEEHSGGNNHTRSGGFFMYEECELMCEECFTLDQRIILPDPFSEETFEVFGKLQKDVEKSESLRSTNKTEEKCFKDSIKIKDKNEIKIEDRQNKQNNAAEEK
ncbi:zinc finger protein 225-like [Centruroides sculpturatus]|uniref:zinc finger protein 225-like n=1 Tax=Centruroides sculpturatus TaxID=218467 RepID=UPI000C6CC96E|nr:zinc finger protein 225-like [Centruroides sculpturatus]